MQNAVSQALSQEKLNLLATLTPTQQDVFWFLEYRSRIHSILDMSQDYLRKALGCTRETVNIAVALLHELGFIDKINRGYRITCVYIVLFKEFFSIQKLQSVFSHTRLREEIPSRGETVIKPTLVSDNDPVHTHDWRPCDGKLCIFFDDDPLVNEFLSFADPMDEIAFWMRCMF